MRNVETEEKRKTVSELDRLPGEHFVKPYEIVLFLLLVGFVLFAVFPKEKLNPKKESQIVIAEPTVQNQSKSKPKEEKISKFSLEYIKNLLKTTEYSKKEIVLTEYIDKLLKIGHTDLAYQVLENYKVYIKYPKDYFLLKYRVLYTKYIQTTSRKEKTKIKKELRQTLKLLLTKGYNDLKVIKFVYRESKKFNFPELVERSIKRLIVLDKRNKKRWLLTLINYKLQTNRLNDISNVVVEYAKFINTEKNYNEKKKIMKKAVKVLLSIQDYKTLEQIITLYKDYFINDPNMVKFLIKASLMADNPSLASEISQEFLEGRR